MNTPIATPQAAQASPTATATDNTAAAQRKHEAECAKLEAERAKLSAEADYQRHMNRFWWLKWPMAGIVAGLSITTIVNGVAKDHLFMLRDNIAHEKLRSEALTREVGKLATQKEDVEKQKAELLLANEKLQEERIDVQRQAERLEQQSELLRTEVASSEATLEELRTKMRGSGNDSRLQAELGNVTASLQAEQERSGKLEIDLRIAREQLQAQARQQSQQQCTFAFSVLTGGPPQAGADAAKLLSAVMQQYSPFNDFSGPGDRTNRRAKDLGIPAGTQALGAIGMAAGKPIVFSDKGVHFPHEARVALLPYAALPVQKIQPDGDDKLQIGTGYRWDLRSSNFKSTPARVLLLQLAQLVQACPQAFPPPQA